MVAECKSPISSAITNLPSRENTTQTCCTLWREPEISVVNWITTELVVFHVRIALEPPAILSPKKLLRVPLRAAVKITRTVKLSQSESTP